MTTFTTARPDRDVTQEEDGNVEAAVQSILTTAGSTGLRLHEVLDKLTQDGFAIPPVSRVITQLIRRRNVELTLDRRLVWNG